MMLFHPFQPKAGLGYGVMFHGEAVAIGIHMAAVMSQKLGWIDSHLVDRIVRLLKFYNVRGGLSQFFLKTSFGLWFRLRS